MLEQVTQAPPDAILGLNEDFLADPREQKVNLTVGVYRDEQGRTPVLQCVKAAEQRLVEQESTKAYLGIAGMVPYQQLVGELLFGKESSVIADERLAVVQTPGGTGGLRVAGEFLARNGLAKRIWCSRPTWANHHNVFRAAGLDVASYDYLDATGTLLDQSGLLRSLEQIPSGDVVCLHGCCHNPTGVDPDPDTWASIVTIAAEKGWLPLVDFAYQGFAEGIDEDASAVRAFAEKGIELMVVNSFSKNFGLYAERTGALTVVTGDAQAVAPVVSQLKQVIRANYSNPPKHGAAIVATVLEDAGLCRSWKDEVRGMRDRIAGLRTALVEGLQAQGVRRDVSYLLKQRGMFSYSGLSPLQVDQLRSEHAIYLVRSGRINVAGLNQENLETVCRAIAQVIE